MRGTLASILVVLACARTGFGLINPNFTPRHLVEQAEVIAAGPLAPAAGPLQWTLRIARQLKGQAGRERVLSLARCDKDHLAEVSRTIRANGSAEVIFFSGSGGDRRKAFLHVAGTWLSAEAAANGQWDVTGPAPRMSATYAGGTDMLIRMSEHLLADPRAPVPVSASVGWLEHVKVGQVGGEAGPMAAVELGKAAGTHLFVASTAGDRLYRAATKDDETSFEDVTAGAGLDTSSRQFAWMDVDGDGLADLASWGDAGLSVRLGAARGTFRPAEGWSFRMREKCLGLAACSRGGRRGLLVSTYGPPIHLAAGPNGWQPAAMPDGPAPSGGRGELSACVVADLDNDGFADVLQPAERGGLLWRGKADGFHGPAAAAVATGGRQALAAVGDFDGDGSLDVVLAGPERNSLWAGDGRGGFREVLRDGGSLSYKCPPAASDVAAMDLNHDGWQDLCFVYRAASLHYHFNRGFRSFGEEGEVRLDAGEIAPGQVGPGQRSLAAADFNGDGSQDLAVLGTDGSVWCCLNGMSDMPGLRLRLGKDLAGPVTAVCGTGAKGAGVRTAASVTGHVLPTFLAVRAPGKVTVTFRLPGQAEQSREVVVARAPKDVVLAAGAGP